MGWMDKDNWKLSKEYIDANHDAKHWFYNVSTIGYKYNMNDLAASVGLAQLEKLNEIKNLRKIY